MQRIQVNPAHMMLDRGKRFLEDVDNFGFVALYVDPNNLDVISLCSPSGHIQIFQAIEHGILFPTEIEDVLFKSDHIKKVALSTADVDAFKVANGMSRLDVIEIDSVIRRNIPEVENDILGFLTQGLGETCSFEKVDLIASSHVLTYAVRARSIAFGIWNVAF